MAVYLQFDSVTRVGAYLQKTDLIAGIPTPKWYPNDNYSNGPGILPYQINKNDVQTASHYTVFYTELNDTNNRRTIRFLEHCKDKPVNLVYSVEMCTVTVPANAMVIRTTKTDQGPLNTYNSVLEEPYLYVQVMPAENAEGNLIYSNNPSVKDATFIVWIDKINAGPQSDPIPSSPPGGEDPVDRPTELIPTADLTLTRWLVYKSCMRTVMRLDLLTTQEWFIRIYDRFGNDLVIPESDAGGAGFDATKVVGLLSGQGNAGSFKIDINQIEPISIGSRLFISNTDVNGEVQQALGEVTNINGNTFTVKNALNATYSVEGTNISVTSQPPAVDPDQQTMILLGIRPLDI